jgi:two-component system phosphate regulon response regulator PhoB
MPLILVVDDDPDISRLLEFTLANAGMRVACRVDGAAGVSAAQELHPDLVLLDWMMPELTGIEACRMIRADPTTGSIPVVLLTANARETDVQNGLEAGADDYIVKPFSPRALLARVQSLLAEQASTDEPSTEEPFAEVKVRGA